MENTREKTKLLIIEDEEAIADLLAYGLNREGFEAFTAHSAAEGLLKIGQVRPDLLLLDWMLPDLSGLEVCRQVTATYKIPIIMITAKSDITDKIQGLEYGADDYITKPFDLREVAVRIRTVLRRVSQANVMPEAPAAAVIRFRDVEIVEQERTVRIGGEDVDLTPKEFDLLLTLCKYRGKIFTRTELLDFVWGYDYTGDTRTVDIHIQRLRKKLGAGDLIVTVFGVGYKFEKQVD
ncbi:DNA-binding response regulator [Paenibacillus chitinolyticus]|uniref:DNA-binding response regulator n=1 Tax=Paenibacillus chitinolyticus TaxID=79263 RepID=A0A410WZJ7_9BACL|nr:response regulator transcription factor [Paenibacillus chitinolyticus]MCY9590378.1 response regulator transcription factor [Paenibacillus chitinolyticus]MCY9596628.1 response regulator transcription factor [Paenibacillus chitinolyticus]QAV19632.1 DNA-binding response regulator [Paenibacillus chitinolyticus]